MDLNNMNVNNLLQRKKYHNPKNLFMLDYDLHNISNTNEATIIFLSNQSKLNLIKLDEISMNYVFNISQNKNKEIEKYELEQKKLLEKYKLNSQLLKIDNSQVLKYLTIFTKKGFGYQTYGDYEHWYAYYASVIMNYTSFVEFINTIKLELENIPQRVGLGKIWIEKMKKYYDQLETVILINEEKT